MGGERYLVLLCKRDHAHMSDMHVYVTHCARHQAGKGLWLNMPNYKFLAMGLNLDTLRVQQRGER